MDIERFREEAHAWVEWMADYLEGIEDRPVRAQVAPGDLLARLPAGPPEDPEPMEALRRDVDALILPGLTHWQHPSFFAYFPANSSPPSVLAEMITATLGVQGMVWQTSPAATELEQRVLDWLRQAIGLPDGFAGVIQDSASSATLCALLTARERASGWETNEAGLAGGPPPVAYCSEEAHASVEKGARIAGYGRRGVVKIPTDARLGLRPDALEAAIEADRAAGRRPACVVATLGTTGASGFDPLKPIGELCRRHGLYLHVDAAWAGSALVLPEHRWMIEGAEAVDSFVFNPHKWLFTNFDCSAHFVRDPAALTRTFDILPEYLKTREGDEVVNYRDWGIPLGRRFRALKLWFVLRTYGLSGLRARIAEHIRLAHGLADALAAEPDFEVVVPPTLSLFVFRHRPDGLADEQALEAHNQRLLDALNDSGALYLSHTRVRGTWAIRFQVGQTRTEARHVEAAGRRIVETARALAAGAPR